MQHIPMLSEYLMKIITTFKTSFTKISYKTIIIAGFLSQHTSVYFYLWNLSTCHTLWPSNDIYSRLFLLLLILCNDFNIFTNHIMFCIHFNKGDQVVCKSFKTLPLIFKQVQQIAFLRCLNSGANRVVRIKWNVIFLPLSCACNKGYMQNQYV